MKKIFSIEAILNSQANDLKPGDEVVFVDSQVEAFGLYNSALLAAKIHDYAIRINCVVVQSTEKIPGVKAIDDQITTITFEPSPFVKKVKEMREAQQEYFRTRSKDVLARAKRLESEVDKLLP